MICTTQWESLCLVRAFPFSVWQMKRLYELWNLEVTSGYSQRAYPGHYGCWDGSCSSWAPDQLKPAASIGWFENWGHNKFGKNEGLYHRVTPDSFACLIYRQGVKFLPLLRQWQVGMPFSGTATWDLMTICKSQEDALSHWAPFKTCLTG